MSKYTTEVRFICEQLAGKYESEGLLNLNEVLDIAVPKVFDFDYPIFDENYRNVLQRKILKHFYTREIGYETYALWKMNLDTRLNEIMPYYNQLYSTIVTTFNPQYEMDYHRVGEATDDNSITNTGTVVNDASGSVESNTESSDSNTEKIKMSDTPQGGVNGLDTDTYLTNYTRRDSEGSGETNTNQTSSNLNTRTDNTLSKINNNRDYEEHIYGVRSSSSFMDGLLKFRESILNIDMMIIENLSDLFMNLW